MDNERKILPKQAFDSEYMTEFLREMRFLSSKGIRYTYIRKTRKYGVSQFKYKKTPALFAALVEFYATLEAERNVRRELKEEKKEDTLLSANEIKKAQEILEKAAKQINTEEAKDDTI
jgi:hypothetical protein